MEMEDIEYVKAINDCGSLTRAAESLYISQPSLSMYIKNMQARLGFPVFNQIGKKYELTFLGERFLAAGIEILRMRENFYDEAAHILDNKIGRLRVSIPFMRGSYLAPDILPKFNEIYPNIEVELIEESSKVVEEKINNGEADIAIMNMPHHALNLDFEIIKSEEILLAVPSGHPCINQGKPNPKSSYPSIDLHLFKKDRFILHFPDQRTGQIAEAIFAEHHFVPNKVTHTRNIETAVNLTMTGYGISFLNETHIRHLKFGNAPRFFSFEGKPHYADMIVAYRKGRKLPPYIRTLIDLCREVV